MFKWIGISGVHHAGRGQGIIIRGADNVRINNAAISCDGVAGQIGVTIQDESGNGSNNVLVSDSIIGYDVNGGTSGQVCETGISVADVAGQDVTLDNIKVYGSSTSITLNQRITARNMSLTYNNLSTGANGSYVYCSDCTVAATCAAGGTGALARRINGAWVCSEGGGVTGSGTAGRLPVWTGSSSLGDSALSQSAAEVTVDRSLVVQGQVETQSTEAGSVTLNSTSGGSVALQAPSVADNFALVLPATNGTLEVQGHEHDAAAITSGVFADARVAQSNVTQHQGALQLGASQITSGTLALARGGTKQTSWTAGRCVQVSADGAKLESAGGACATGGSFDPMDDSTLWFREDFPTVTTASQQIGAYGWTLSCASGTLSVVSKTGSSPYKKAYRLETGATSGNQCQITLGSSASNATAIGRLQAYAPWDSSFSFRRNSAASTGEVMFVGYIQGGGNTPGGGATTDRIGIEYDATRSDTAFMFVACDGSACTRQSSGVAINTGWHKVRIRSQTAGTVIFALDGGTEVSISSNVSTGAMAPIFGTKTAEAAAKRVEADRWYWSGTNAQ